MSFTASRFVPLQGILVVALLLSLAPAEGWAGVKKLSSKTRISKLALKAQVRANRRAGLFGTGDRRTVQAQALADRLTGRSGLITMPRVTRMSESQATFSVGTVILRGVKQYGKKKGLFVGTTTVRFAPGELTGAALQRRLKIHGEDAASLAALGKLGLQTRVVRQSFEGVTYAFKLNTESSLGRQIEKAYGTAN